MKIKAQYNHSKIGTFMFNLCAGWTKFVVKHRWLYYILALTWGFIMTLIGLIISLALIIAGGCSKELNTAISFSRYLWIYYAKAGPDYWGGFEMGLMFVRDQKSVNELNQHEFGHTFQNCLLGPLFIFICFIPSVTRYWIQEIRNKKGKQNPDYDAIWFEDSASQCGKYAEWYIENNKKAK